MKILKRKEKNYSYITSKKKYTKLPNAEIKAKSNEHKRFYLFFVFFHYRQINITNKYTGFVQPKAPKCHY